MAASNTGKVVGGVAAGVFAIASALIAKYEGSRNEAYWDPYGKVWTICEGHTGADVKEGVVYDDAKCAEIRAHDIAIANATVKRCLTMPMLVQIEGALTDGTYNIGPRLVCGSTLQKYAIANNWPAACNELRRWDKAGGRVLKGLTRRRTDDAGICEGRPMWEQIEEWLK